MTFISKMIATLCLMCPIASLANDNVMQCQESWIKIYQSHNTLDEKLKQWKEYEPACSDTGYYVYGVADFYLSHGHLDDQVVSFLENSIAVADYRTSEHKVLLALAYSSMDKEDELAKLALQLSKEEPEFRGTHHVMGLYYFMKSNWVKAKESYLRALSIQPDILFAHLDLTRVYYELNDFDNVQHHYQKAFKLNPLRTILSRESSGAMANVYLQKGELEWAKQTLDNQEKWDKTVYESSAYQKNRQIYEAMIASSRDFSR